MEKIDWSKQIEAVHEDGRVVSAKVEDPAENGDETVGVRRDDGNYMHVREDGVRFARCFDDGWSIRNVPSTPSPTPDDLKERCVALVRKFASRYDVFEDDVDIVAWCAQARAIMKAMEPVDVDMIEARECAAPFVDALSCDILDGGYDSSPQVQAALAAIKRGRALERGE